MVRWSPILVPALGFLAACGGTQPAGEILVDDSWFWCSVDPGTIPKDPDPLRAATRQAAIVLQVDSLDTAAAAIQPMLRAHGAYEAGRAPGLRRAPGAAPEDTPWPAITMVLRVETRHLGGLVDALKELGTVLDDRHHTADPGEAAVELQARLAAARQNEARIQGRIESQDTPADAIPGLEGELSKVREGIASLAARNYVLRNSVDSASLTIHLMSPPKPSPAATFMQDVRATFLGSAPGIKGFACHLPALGVAALPWMALAAAVAWVIARRRERSRRP